jgi:hypothetical protein
MSYHPYKSGYSTLPGLRRISPGEVFERGQDESEALMLEKRGILEGRRFFWESDCSPEIYSAVAAWVREWHPWHPTGDFLGVSMLIPEDLLIHRVSGGRDWFAAAALCFPSQWDPGEKIGRTWEEIHRPVPMDLGSSSKIVRAMVHSGPFERFVWSVVYDRRYDFHPGRPRSTFAPGNPLVKVERQVTVPFGDFCLFVLRQYLVEDYDREALARAIEGMDEEQRRYKGLEEPEGLLEWLRG